MKQSNDIANSLLGCCIFIYDFGKAYKRLLQKAMRTKTTIIDMHVVYDCVFYELRFYFGELDKYAFVCNTIYDYS